MHLTNYLWTVRATLANSLIICNWLDILASWLEVVRLLSLTIIFFDHFWSGMYANLVLCVFINIGNCLEATDSIHNRIKWALSFKWNGISINLIDMWVRHTDASNLQILVLKFNDCGLETIVEHSLMCVQVLYCSTWWISQFFLSFGGLMLILRLNHSHI